MKNIFKINHIRNIDTEMYFIKIKKKCCILLQLIWDKKNVFKINHIRNRDTG